MEGVFLVVLLGDFSIKDERVDCFGFGLCDRFVFCVFAGDTSKVSVKSITSSSIEVKNKLRFELFYENSRLSRKRKIPFKNLTAQ